MEKYLYDQGFKKCFYKKLTTKDKRNKHKFITKKCFSCRVFMFFAAADAVTESATTKEEIF